MSLHPTRRSVLAGAGATLVGLAGCLGGSDGTADANGGSSDGGSTGSGGTTAAGGDGDGGSGGDTATDGADAAAAPPEGVLPVRETPLPVQYEFSHIRDRTVSGGPPKDGIPSVDEPAFESTSAADEWLAPGDVVFGVAMGDDVKAYPQRVLVWHEITNDVVDGENVSVTYCPLTGTAMGFFRGETTFGVSGNLVNSNLVMYDRATDSRWPQMLATAVEGRFEGNSLSEFPVTWTTYGKWKDLHPDTQVLSRDTGFARNYGNDPYGAYNPARGYYTNTNTLFPPLERDGEVDFNPKRVVIGARDPEAGAIAFLKDTLREAGVLTVTAGGVEFVAVYDPPLDTAHVYRNPEGASVEWADGQVAVDGETTAPGDAPLEALVDFDAMWFAWFGFYPETEVAR